MRIVVANLKGGSGKSSTCVNLAAGLVKLGGTVALVDADPQGSVSDWAAVRAESAKMPFSVVAAARKTLHRDADDLQGDREHLIIDTPAKIAAITVSAMSAADLILIPVSTSAYDLWGCEQTLQKIDEVKALYPEIVVKLMISRAKVGTAIVKELTEALSNLDADLPNADLLKTVIYNRVSVAHTANGLTIYETADDKAKAEYSALAKEILNLSISTTHEK